jgi:hypothetical protein
MLPIEYATALYTFIKLLTCYKAWWEKYDFKDDECGYSIIAYKVEAKWEEGFGKKPEFLVRFNSSPNNPLFRFSSKCLAEKFIESFKDLLEEAAIFFYV